MPEIAITATEAASLFEEKLQRTRTDMGQAEKASREATTRRDQALHEVTTLQKEKSALIEEIALARQDVARIKGELAQHRANVEASLTKQERGARSVIDDAAAQTAALKARESAVQQLKAQVVGIKATLKGELSTLTAAVQKVVEQAEASLAQIPD